jgi:hypothetical protein
VGQVSLAGGQILNAIIPAIAGATGGGVDLGSIVGQLVGGGGAILTVIIGLIKTPCAANGRDSEGSGPQIRRTMTFAGA